MNILVLLALAGIFALTWFGFVPTIPIPPILVALVVAVGVSYVLTLLLADSDVFLHILSKIGLSPKRVLKDKVVWITGASRGIGRAVAIKLAKCGCRLVLSARSKDKLEEVKKECMKKGELDESDVLIVSFDMLDYTAHRPSFQKVVDHFDKIDILVSNAGALQQANWEKTETSVDHSVFELNVFSLISLARIVTEHFIARGAGQHVISSSIAGRMPFPKCSAYCASKYAVQGYFETLMTEYGTKGLSVTLLILGPINTKIFDTAATTDGKKTYKYKKLMTAKRAAHLIAVAISHKLPEVIICSSPILFFAYFATQLTLISQICMKFINYRRIHEKVNTKG